MYAEIGTTLRTTGTALPNRMKSLGSAAIARQAATADVGVRSPRSHGSAGRSSRQETVVASTVSMTVKHSAATRIRTNSSRERST